MKKNFLLTVISCLLILSCKVDTNEITVELKSAINDSLKFNPIFEDLYAETYAEYYPEYYKKQLKDFNFSNNDSIVITTFNSDYKNFYFDLYNDNFISKEKLLDKKVDTIFEGKKEEQTQLLVLSDFSGKTQDIYIKTNKENNYKFYYSFPKNFENLSNTQEIIQELPFYDFSYSTYNEENKTTFRKKVKIYPSLKNTNYISSNSLLAQKSRITISLRGYWRGTFKYKSQKFDVAVQGFNSLYSSVLIKNDSLSFSYTNYPYNTNFSYNIKDTIDLNDDLFVFDSINNDLSKIKFKKIDSADPFFSHRIETKIKDFKYVDLEDQDLKLSSFLDKEYLLIYFWGTWCKPCVKGVPDLVKIQEDYKDKMNIVGVAYDKNKDRVKEFVNNNNITWSNHFTNKRKGIIRNLKITEYPTLILINKDMRILYRGVEKEELMNVISKL